MTYQKKLTTNDLALYLGCEMYAETPTASGFVHVRKGVFVGIKPLSLNKNQIIVDVEIDGGVLDMYFTPERVKPILRPLSDITEEEARELLRICDYIDGTGLFDLSNETEEIKQFIIGDTKGWAYLLRRHFDLFGWIDAGLAIDKTKTI